MDRFIPPLLGRRRGWIVICQAFIICWLIAMALTNPASMPGFMAVLAFLLSFSSASQDIVIDAYRVDALSPVEYGAGTAVYVTGYRIAMAVSGGGALILSDHMPWRAVYLVMGLLMLIGVVTTWYAPEPKVSSHAPRSLKDAFTQPLIEFFKRKGAIEVLIFLVIYKLDTNLTVAMTTPFMMDLGFSKTVIGSVSKTGGIMATIVGTLFGGGIMYRLGIHRALWIFGITQAVAGLSYLLLAHLGHNYAVMVFAVAAENLFSGMGIAAQNAFMMAICDKGFSATQFALISSFMALSRYVAGAPSGWLAKHVGWEGYYLVCVLIGIPGLLLLTRYRKWSMPSGSRSNR
jgi:PAT family beta-lactamase induction signal transducer AmpG